MKSFSTLLWESFKEAEEGVGAEEGSTPGLSLEALTTSSEDLAEIFSHPLVGGTWVDLGSGYGHTVFSYLDRFPNRRAIGIEKETSRWEISRKVGESLGTKAEFLRGDLLTEKLPAGDTFFLYFPQGHVLDRILSELAKLPKFSLVAIESHGDLFPRLEKESWLVPEGEIPLVSSRHHPAARIYRAASEKRELSGLHRVSFLERHLLVETDHVRWWGESFGLSASGRDYLLQYPPRTIREKDVVKIVTKEELTPELRFLVELRRREDVTVHTTSGTHRGPFRKILEAPAFSVEFPSGERVEWDSITRIFQGPHLCYDSSSASSFLPPAPPEPSPPGESTATGMNQNSNTTSRT